MVDTTYNISLTNRFAFLQTNEDFESQPRTVVKAELSISDSKNAKKSKTGVLKDNKSNQVIRKNEASEPKNFDSSRKPLENRVVTYDDENVQNKVSYNNRGKTSRGRLPRNAGVENNREKRVFDRKSGSEKSSVRPFEKKSGAGSHNWGKEGEQFVDEKPELDVSKPEPVVDQEGDRDPEELPEVQLTLDEYMANVACKRPVVEVSLRKAGEGDDAKWQKGRALVKEQDESDQDTEVYVKGGSGRIKNKLDIVFGDERRNSRGGQRGGFRGRGGNRGRFGDRAQGDHGDTFHSRQSFSNIQYDDTNFPSLS